MDKLDLSRPSLRKFGLTMGVAFLVIASVVFLKHRSFPGWLVFLSAVFFISGFLFPVILKPLYVIWMRLAFILGWVNTRLILGVLFYLIFTPIGLVLRLLGNDLLDRKIEKQKDSYWKKREVKPYDPKGYERQF